MPDVDEYGIPIKSSQSPQTDEFGIPIRKKSMVEVVPEKRKVLTSPEEILQEAIRPKPKQEKSQPVINNTGGGFLNIGQPVVPKQDSKAIKPKADHTLPDVKEAIDNSVNDYFNNYYGKNFKPTEKQKELQKENVIQEYKKGNLVPKKNADGTTTMKRGTGFLESFINTVEDVYNKNLENRWFASLSKDEQKKYLNLEAKNPGLIFKGEGETAASGSGGHVGEFLGETAEMLGKGTIGAIAGASTPYTGGAGFGTFLATAQDAAMSGYSQTLKNNYIALKSENPDMSDDEAYERANASALIGETVGLATNAILSGNMGSTLKPTVPVNGVVDGIKQSLKHSVESAPKVIGSAVAGQLVNEGAKAAVGVDVTLNEALKNATEAGKEMAIMHFGLQALTEPTRIPSYLRPQIENVVASAPREQVENIYREAETQGLVPEGTTDRVMTKLSEFDKFKKVVDDMPIAEESKAAATGKLIQRQKLIEQKEELAKYGASFNDKISSIDAEILKTESQINGILKSDSPFKFESDKLTGESLSKPKLFEDLTSKEIEGIVVPKEYGEADVIEVGEGENKRYKPVANIIRQEKGLELKDKIKITDESFKDKSKAQSVANKALAQHYYDNAMDNSMKPEAKKNVTVIMPNENKSPEIVTKENINQESQSPFNTLQNEQQTTTIGNEEMGSLSRGQETGQGIRSEGGQQGGLETRQEGYQENNGQNEKEVIPEVEPIGIGGRERVSELEKIPFDKRTDKQHSDFVKQKFANEFVAKGVPKEQVDAAVALMEARAKASGEGDRWFRKIADIGNGEFQGGDIKYQGEWKKAIIAAAIALQPLKEASVNVGTKGIDVNRIQKEAAATKAGKDFIEKIVKDYYGETPPQEVVDRAIQLWEIYGKPEMKGDTTKTIAIVDGKVIPVLANDRAYAQKIKDSADFKIKMGNITDLDDFIAEISHAAQFVSDAKMDDSIYVNQEQRDKFEYDRKGSLEYDAHTLIEPYLTNYVFTGRKGVELMNTTTLSPKVRSELEPTLKKYNIKFQDNKGALETLKDGKMVIHALKSPDFSTMVHEIGHVFESELTSDEVRTVNKFGGSEAFARGFERYLRDGNAPTRELRSLFDKFKQWLTNIYQSLKGSPIEKEVSPEIKQIFDRLLTEQKNEIKAEGESVQSKESKVNMYDLPFELSDDDLSRLQHVDTEQMYKELGLDDRIKRVRKNDADLEIEANKLIKKWEGDIVKVADAVINGKKRLNDAEQVAFTKVVGALKKKSNSIDPRSEEFDAIVNRIEQLDRASDISGSETGAALRARQLHQFVQESLADYIMQQKDASNVAVLTIKQKEQNVKEFEQIQKAKKEFDEYVAKKEAELSQREAAAAIVKETQSVSTGKKTKKTHQDYKSERKQISESIKDKLKKARGNTNVTIVPYANELIAIAPDVAKLMKSYVEEGIVELGEIVKNIHAQLRDDIEGITEKDVIDIIAGKYNEKKPTKNSLVATLRDLKEEAKLITQLEALENGEKPVNEKKQVEKNQKIKALREKIKSLKEDDTKLGAAKTRLKNQIEKIEEQLKTGDFETKKVVQRKTDQEELNLRDKYLKLKEDRDIRLLEDEYSRRSVMQKGKEVFNKIWNTPKAIKGTFDVSYPFRQGIWNISRKLLSNPFNKKGLFFNQKDLIRDFNKMYSSLANEDVYRRIINDITTSPRYELAKKSGLALTDVNSPLNIKREELFGSNYAEKIPFIGRSIKLGEEGVKIPFTDKKIKTIGGLVKSSERAFTAMGMVQRWNHFNDFVSAFEKRGLTFEKDPQAFKEAAIYANQASGVGNLGEGLLKSANGFLSKIIWSTKLAASRLQLLTKYANLKFWTKVPQEVRVAYLKDMVKFVSMGMSVLFIAKSMGLSVELDPRSSEFGTVKVGNTRYDIWGGMKQYVTLLFRMISGETKTTTGEINPLGSGYGQTSRNDIAMRFVRGKLTPEIGGLVNAFDGENIVGEPTSFGNEAVQLFNPLIVQDMRKALSDESTQNAFISAVLTAHGIGVNEYLTSEQKKTQPVDWGTVGDAYINSIKDNVGSDIEIRDEKTNVKRKLTSDELRKFQESRDKYITEKLKSIMKKGLPVLKNGSVEVVKMENITNEQLSDEMRKIRTEATREVKEKMFPENPIEKSKEHREQEILNRFKKSQGY